MRFELALAVIAFGVFTGCNGPGNNDSAVTGEGTHADTHQHAHPSAGPHHGQLIELGNEEYHAELVHDASSVTIYIVDSSGQKTVAVDAVVAINAMLDGKPEQFALAPQPDQGDADGKSSRYVSTDQALAAHIDDHSSAAKLSIQIDGTPYRAELKHDHDHAGHDHAGHDHAGHDHEEQAGHADDGHGHDAGEHTH